MDLDPLRSSPDFRLRSEEPSFGATSSWPQLNGRSYPFIFLSAPCCFDPLQQHLPCATHLKEAFVPGAFNQAETSSATSGARIGVRRLVGMQRGTLLAVERVHLKALKASFSVQLQVTYRSPVAIGLYSPVNLAVLSSKQGSRSKFLCNQENTSWISKRALVA